MEVQGFRFGGLRSIGISGTSVEHENVWFTLLFGTFRTNLNPQETQKC